MANYYNLGPAGPNNGQRIPPQNFNMPNRRGPTQQERQAFLQERKEREEEHRRRRKKFLIWFWSIVGGIVLISIIVSVSVYLHEENIKIKYYTNNIVATVSQSAYLVKLSRGEALYGSGNMLDSQIINFDYKKDPEFSHSVMDLGSINLEEGNAGADYLVFVFDIENKSEYLDMKVLMTLDLSSEYNLRVEKKYYIDEVDRSELYSATNGINVDRQGGKLKIEVYLYVADVLQSFDFTGEFNIYMDAIIEE